MSDRRSVMVILGLAIVVRGLCLIGYGDQYVAAGMASTQGVVARQVLAGRGFTLDRPFATCLAEWQKRENRLIEPAEAERLCPGQGEDAQPFALGTPGIAILLAGFWAVTGHQGYLPLQILQILLDAVNVLLLHALGDRIAGPRTGLLAAGMYACYPPAILYAVLVLDVVWVTNGILLVALLADRLVKVEGRSFDRVAAGAGLLSGLFAYVRSNTLLLPLALGIAIIPTCGWRRAVRAGALGCAAAFLAFLPWLSHQYVVLGSILPLGRTGTGQLLWEGLGEVPNRHGAVASDDATFAQVRATRPDVTYGSLEYDALLLDRFHAVLREDPGFVFRVVFRRALRAWRLPGLPEWPEASAAWMAFRDSGRGGRLAFARTELRYAAFLAGDRLLGALLPCLALLGALAWRRDLRRWMILISIAGMWYTAQLPFLYVARVFYPGLLPAQFLLAAAGIAWLAAAGARSRTLSPGSPLKRESTRSGRASWRADPESVDP